jgi:WD40 repeat protein
MEKKVSESALLHMDVSPDGAFIATGSGKPDEALSLWDVRTLERLAYVPNAHFREVDAVAFAGAGSNHGTLLASAGREGNIKVWMVSAKGGLTELAHYDGAHHDFVSSLSFLSDGMRVLSGSWDGSIAITKYSAGANKLEVSDGPKQIVPAR